MKQAVIRTKFSSLRLKAKTKWRTSPVHVCIYWSFCFLKILYIFTELIICSCKYAGLSKVHETSSNQHKVLISHTGSENLIDKFNDASEDPLHSDTGIFS